MKRIVNNLVPALGAGALLALGATAQAQNTISIGSASALDVKPGGTYVVDEVLNPGTGNKITAFQSFLVYDPTVFTATATWANDDPNTGNNTPDPTNSTDFDVTAKSKQSKFVVSGTTYVSWEFLGARAGSNSALPANYKLGTVTLTAINPAAKFGESDVFLTFNGTGSPINGTVPNADVTKITSSPSAASGFGNFILKPRITPGPSSLLVFAMGGAAPILGVLRRRRSRA